MSILQKVSDYFGIEYKANDFSLASFSFERFGMFRRGKTALTEANAGEAYRYHELVFACINKTAEVMNDAEIIVEQKDSNGEWKRVEGHLLSALFKRPNQVQTGRDIRKLMVQSELCTGKTYLQINRSAAGVPVEIIALNPARVRAVWNGDRSEILYYEYLKNNGRPSRIGKEDLLIRRRADLLDQLGGFAPVAVALKSINSDIGLTDYVDAFFESDGTPSGILKIANRTIKQTEAEALAAQWKSKFGRGGSSQKGVAVLDKDSEYQKIGANLNELAADSISDRFESRICSPFGVPPILVGALVGIKYTTANATAKSALRDFWDNKISPELAVFREWLTWYVLPEFEDIEAIRREQIRVGFDISQAAFLQEDVNEIHSRARENVRAGFWTINEARTATGMKPDPKGDYYLQPSSVSPITPELQAQVAVQKVEQGNASNEEEKPATGDETAKEEAKKSKGLNNLNDAQLERFEILTHIEKMGNLIPAEIAELDSLKEIVKKKDSQKKTKKTVEYDGLILGREPRGVELLIDLKSLVSDFETEKEKAAKILTTFRNELIGQAVEEIEKLDESQIYALTLAPNPKTRKQVEKVLRSAFERGRAQIVNELNAQKTVAKSAENMQIFQTKDLDDDFDDITRISDSIIAKIINEIQSRSINLFVEAKFLKIALDAILEWIADKLEEQSVKFIEQTASVGVNAIIQSGRKLEMSERADEVKYFTFSGLFDKNQCEPCAEVDGMESDNLDDLPDAPYSECEGLGNCRCFVVAVIE